MRAPTTTSCLFRRIIQPSMLAIALQIGQLCAHAQLIQETQTEVVKNAEQPSVSIPAVKAELPVKQEAVKVNSDSDQGPSIDDSEPLNEAADPTAIQSTKKERATPSRSANLEKQTETKPKRLALLDENNAAPREAEISGTTDDDASVELTIADQPKKAGDQSVPTPVAEDVDLSDPVVVTPATIDESNSEQLNEAGSPNTKPKELPKPVASAQKEALILLGEEVAPGTSARLSWSPDQNFAGIATPTPVLVVNGNSSGKNMCLTAAVHGDELNGIEIVRRVMYGLDPKILRGAVIGIPIVNLQGFRRNSRYLPDRRDLNRFFPGSAHGSSASRIAHSFFEQIVTHCDALVDIHTGSFLRTNLPQLRADMTVPEVARLTEGFGATAVLHSIAANGTLRQAAVAAGVPTVTLETGEPSRLQEKEIEHGTKGIQTLLNKLNMTRRIRVWGDPEPVYYQSVWVRADQGGLLFNNVKLGQRVREDQILGTITDPITNVRIEVRSPKKGRILGMALNQVVMPGFAAFRIGIPTTETEVVQPSDAMPEAVAAPEQGEKSPSMPLQENAPSIDSEDENSE